MLTRILLAVLALAIGTHHAGTLLGAGDGGHHSAPNALAGGDGSGDGADVVAGTCLAILSLALILPRMRGIAAARMAAPFNIFGTAWTARMPAGRGLPGLGGRRPFLLLCSLRH